MRTLTQHEYEVFKLRYGNAVKRALVSLGPTRVQQGGRAFKELQRHGWVNCFLALCFGDAGVLADVAGFQGGSFHNNFRYKVEMLLGLDQEETQAVISLYDHAPHVLADLCEEYLEQNVVKQPPEEITQPFGSWLDKR